MKDKLGCCGLNCEKCDAKLATVHDDDVVGKTERRNLKDFAFFMRSNPKQAIMRKLNKRVQNVFVLLELIFSILCFFC